MADHADCTFINVREFALANVAVKKAISFYQGLKPCPICTDTTPDEELCLKCIMDEKFISEFKHYFDKQDVFVQQYIKSKVFETLEIKE